MLTQRNVKRPSHVTSPQVPIGNPRWDGGPARQVEWRGQPRSVERWPLPDLTVSPPLPAVPEGGSPNEVLEPKSRMIRA